MMTDQFCHNQGVNSEQLTTRIGGNDQECAVRGPRKTVASGADIALRNAALLAQKMSVQKVFQVPSIFRAC